MTNITIKQYLKRLMLKDIVTYEVRIDEEFAENGEDLGIDLISNVKNPAIKIKGMAFSCDSVKNLTFTDSKKFRIAAPVMVPDDIYRNDDEEYVLRFTPEIIEKLAKKFMSKLTNKNGGVFNLEHGDEMIDSYIFEAIFVDSDAKVKMIKEDYGIDLPLSSFFIVQQFNNKDKYEELVANGQTGFSLEGFLGMELVQMSQAKINKNKNSKLSKMGRKLKFVGTKRTFKTASKKRLEEVIEDEELIIVAESIEEGAEVVVIEDVTAGPIEDFTGEVEVNGDVLIIEEGKITEVVTQDVAEEVVEELEEVKEEVIEEEMESDKKEEEMEEVIPTEGVDVEAKFGEVYEMIAELKAEIASLKEPVIEEEVVMNKSKFSDVLRAFNEFNKNK